MVTAAIFEQSRLFEEDDQLIKPSPIAGRYCDKKTRNTKTRNTMSMLMSLSFHGLIVTLTLWLSTYSATRFEESAGHAGDYINVTMFDSSSTDLPIGDSIAQPSNAGVLSPPEMPESVKELDNQLSENVTTLDLAVTTVVKPVVINSDVMPDKIKKTKISKPEINSEPSKTLQTKQRVIKTEKSLSQPSVASAQGMGGQTVISNQGDSYSGNAPTGAGSSDSNTVKALNRRINYPSKAKSMGVEGKVRVKFDITESGTITNISVLSENPPGMFSASLKMDMARWRYQTTKALTNQTISVVYTLSGKIKIEK